MGGRDKEIDQKNKETINARPGNNRQRIEGVNMHTTPPTRDEEMPGHYRPPPLKPIKHHYKDCRLKKSL
jgi:hypothetical protein